MSKSSRPTESLTFEESLSELEAGVQRLEQGTSGLEESLQTYEDAIAHLRHCMALLSNAKRKVELVQDVRSDGTIVSQPFGDDERDLEDKQAGRSKRRSADGTSSNRRRSADFD